MNEITLARFHDILYKFFALITCFGLGMLSLDMITLLSGHNLYMFRYELFGWGNLIGLAPVIAMIVFGWHMANSHKKKAKEAKWR